MPERFKFAAVQLSSTSDIDANLEKAEELVSTAAEAGADLIGLPENFAFMGSDRDRSNKVKELSHVCYEFTSSIAAKYNVYLYGGGTPFFCNLSSKVYNRLTFFDPSGNLLGEYDKINLFRASLPSGQFYDESVCVAPVHRVF